MNNSQRLYFLIAFISGAVIFIVQSEQAIAEMSLTPAVSLSEEYNDNIFLSGSEPQSDLITRTTPSLSVLYRTSYWTWDGFYGWEYRQFRKNTQYDGSRQTLSLRNQTEIISNTAYLSATEDVRRVSTDVTRDFTRQGPLLNQVDQNSLIINPYILIRPGEATTVALGHVYYDLTFKRGEGINRTDHTDYVEAGTRVSSHFTTSVGISRLREDNSINDYEQLEAYVGLRIIPAEHYELSGRAGRGRLNYQSGAGFYQTTWNGRIQAQISNAVLILESSRQHSQDPLRISSRTDTQMIGLRREDARTTVSISGAQSIYFDNVVNRQTAFSRSTQGSIRHRVTQRMTVFLESSYQHLEDRLFGSRTYSSQSGLRLSHQLAETLSLAAEYRQSSSYSPTVDVNTYVVNRSSVELRALF